MAYGAVFGSYNVIRVLSFNSFPQQDIVSDHNSKKEEAPLLLKG